jgi:hypothetical protein
MRKLVNYSMHSDCEDEMFLEVVNPARFRNAVAMECRKGS